MPLTLLTFKELYNKAIVALSGATVNYFGPGSALRGILEANTFFAETLQNTAEQTYQARTIRLAKGVDLDGLAANYNVTRKAAQAATGVVTFSRTIAATGDFTILSGNVVATQPILDGSTISFTVNDNITFSSGTTSVTGYVTCTQTGTIGNVASGKVTNNVSAIPGIDAVNNAEAFGSGRDEESDDELRARIPQTMQGLKKGNESAILAAAFSVPEVTFAKVVENSPQTGMFSIYITTSNGVVSDLTKSAVSGAVRADRGFCVPFTVVAPNITYLAVSMIVKKTAPEIDEQQLLTTIRNELNRVISVSTLNTLYISDVIVIVRSIIGVANVSSVTIGEVGDTPSASDFESETFDVLRIQNLTDITATFTS